MKDNKLSKEDLERIITEQPLRIEAAKRNCLLFATIYFSEYFEYDFAPFHYELFNLANDTHADLKLAITFRGSGKSTILTTIYPLYALFGTPQKKLIVIISQTADLAQTHLRNIKEELERNELLKQDLGPFKEVDNTWNAQAIELPQQNAMIIAASIDQKIRGFRYKHHRPDLIICDDIEDSQSVKTEEGRKRTQELYSSEIAPLGDLNTQIVMVGNYLHPNGLISRMDEKIKAKKVTGLRLFVPLIFENKDFAWPEKFKSMKTIEKLRQRVADEVIWAREYLLKIIAYDEHFYTYDNIKFYDEIPTAWTSNFQYRVAGIDLAIADKNTSDYTAVVTAEVYLVNGKTHVFVLPNVFYKRINFVESTELIKSMKEDDPNLHIFVESNGYQISLAQALASQGIEVIPVLTGKLSKRERLTLTVPWHMNGHIHLPKTGAELLLNQLIGFGNERHDDLVDAFSMLINKIIELTKNGQFPQSMLNNEPQIVEIEGDPFRCVALGGSDENEEW